MVNTKSIFATLFALTLLAGSLTSCDSGQNQTTTKTTETTQEQQEVPDSNDGEPMTKETPSAVDTPSPSLPTPNPSVTVPPASSNGSTSTITPPASTIPDLRGATPAPDNSQYKSGPNDTTLLPNQGNVESDGKGGILVPKDDKMPIAKKPTPKPKSESKTQDPAKAVAARKALFKQALAKIPGSSEPKFQEYYKKLDTLVSKIEGQKPLTQESIDAVNKLNMQYPQEAMKFNEGMQKVMPNKKGG